MALNLNLNENILLSQVSLSKSDFADTIIKYVEKKEGRKGGKKNNGRERRKGRRESKGEKKDVGQINQMPYARGTANFAPGNFISTLTFSPDHTKQGPAERVVPTHP